MTYNKNENFCTMSPDNILGATINYGCYLHDRQYRNEVKFRKTRKQSDQVLKNRIYKDLKKSNQPFEIRIKFTNCKKVNVDWLIFTSKKEYLIKFRKKLAYPVSRIYYLGVRFKQTINRSSKRWSKKTRRIIKRYSKI